MDSKFFLSRITLRYFIVGDQDEIVIKPEIVVDMYTKKTLQTYSVIITTQLSFENMSY